MDISQVQEIISDHLELITIDAKSLADAKVRASKLLVVQSVLATFLRDFEEEKSKIKTLQLATYSQVVKSVEGKNVTEKKINVEADPGYASYREALEKMEGIRDYLRTHIKIFENAHLMFRQYSRE